MVLVCGPSEPATKRGFSIWYLRAFDTASGAELWRGRLPTGGHATPMTYRLRDDGRQFVVIAAGGHGMMQSRPGDSLMAFALPR